MARKSARPLLADAGPGAGRVVRASYEEYLALPNEGRLMEWVDGEVVYHMPPTLAHQRLVAYLTTLFTLFSDFFGLGRVIASPAEMKCSAAGPSREPDLMFVATANLNRLADDRRVAGPADLVIEVVSDDSVARDFDEKFIEYQECGVREYWIVDPRERRNRALFYRLGEDGLLESVKPEAGGIFRSSSLPGFWLKVEWLWELPDPLLTFAEIAAFSEQTIQELSARKRAA
jgi:Uma2 family endonuclease